MTHRKPTVINVKASKLRQRGIDDFAKWAARPNSIYIGRNMSYYVRGAEQSKWHNPFKISESRSREESLAAYENYVRSTPELYDNLYELAGKELGCWCKNKTAEYVCHGDVLVKLFEEKYAT